MPERPKSLKDIGMCPHGNFSDACPECQKEEEIGTEKLDALVTRTALELHRLDGFIDKGESLPEDGSPAVERYKRAVESLREKSAEQILQMVDPNGKFKPEQFSSFTVSTDLPGVVHIELGTPDDLEKFRAILEEGTLAAIFKKAGLTDTREAESFAAQYFSKEIFGKGDYLGIVVSISSQFKNEEEKKKALRHEYSHAVVHEVIRPASQQKVVDIRTSSGAIEMKRVVEAMGKDRALQLAENLGVVPPLETPAHMRLLMIGKNLRDEQFLLDELRAYTFNFGYLPPKARITDVNLEDEDTLDGASVEIVKRFFEVHLLHVKAYWTSAQARERSVAILGSTLSLDQARRLLEKEAESWGFEEDENTFLKNVRAWRAIFSKPEHRDYAHQQGGELITQERVREVLIPSKDKIDTEVTRRWGSFEKAPMQFQEDYKALYG